MKTAEELIEAFMIKLKGKDSYFAIPPKNRDVRIFLPKKKIKKGDFASFDSRADAQKAVKNLGTTPGKSPEDYEIVSESLSEQLIEEKIQSLVEYKGKAAEAERVLSSMDSDLGSIMDGEESLKKLISLIKGPKQASARNQLKEIVKARMQISNNLSNMGGYLPDAIDKQSR